jgi:HD-GYP domain-containing protein (c-di-GMP phosphodiesterase class II)
MSSHRPYRPALGLPAALAEIKAQSGIKFDASVVRSALSLFEGKENLDMFYS